MDLSAFQWISVVIGLAGLLFGPGLYFKYHERKKRLIAETEATSSASEAMVLAGNKLENRKGEYVHKWLKLRIAEGEYEDVAWESQKIRIKVISVGRETFKGDVFERECDFAEILVNSGGGLSYGGPFVKQTDVNQFKVPQKQGANEEPVSVSRFHVHEHGFNFQRCLVDHVNPKTKTADIDVFLLSAIWRAP